MAIKVNGTTVIDDSRNLVNIVSGAGSSTATGAVGTYGLFSIGSNISVGSTTSGANLYWVAANSHGYTTTPTISGTWRAMGVAAGADYGISAYATTVFVRIS